MPSIKQAPWPIRGFIWLAVLVLVSAACGGSSDADQSEVGPLESMLQVVLDTEVNRSFIVVHDYARIRELNGMPLPTGPATADSVLEYLIELIRVDPDGRGATFPVDPAFISIGSLANSTFLLPETIGYSFMDVDQDVFVGLSPNGSMAARGRINTDLVNQTIRDCEICPTPDEVTFKGLAYFSWGEDLELNMEARLLPPAFDELGRGGRIAAADGLVMRSLWTEGIEDMIDAHQGGGSLADNPDGQAAIRALDERGASVVYGSDETHTVELLTSRHRIGGFPEGVVWPPPEDEQLLRPYQFLMTGAGVDEDGGFFWLVLVHESSGVAKENARLLPLRVRETKSFGQGAPWSELLEIEELDVSGRLLVAKVRSDVFPGRPYFYMLEPLLLHEDSE